MIINISVVMPCLVYRLSYYVKVHVTNISIIFKLYSCYIHIQLYISMIDVLLSFSTELIITQSYFLIIITTSISNGFCIVINTERAGLVVHKQQRGLWSDEIEKFSNQELVYFYLFICILVQRYQYILAECTHIDILYLDICTCVWLYMVA